MSIGEGHGKKGRYCGLPDPYGSKNHSKIALLPVHFDKTTTYGKGADKGPAALIEASRHLELYDIETDSQVYLEGIYTAPPIKPKTTKQMLDTVYRRTKELLDQGKFVVTLGGEHSISYAPIRAHAERHKKITVLQFDAHADLVEAYEGNPWSHASAMARVKELEGVDRIVSVGIRSMSHSEQIHLDRPNTFFAHEIMQDPQWMDRVIERLSGLVYITFDLDVFDPSIMPSTGTPEPGGLFWYDILKLLRRVIETKKLVGFDLVELLPKAVDRAPDFLAAKLVYKILSFRLDYPKISRLRNACVWINRIKQRIAFVHKTKFVDLNQRVGLTVGRLKSAWRVKRSRETSLAQERTIGCRQGIAIRTRAQIADVIAIN